MTTDQRRQAAGTPTGGQFAATARAEAAATLGPGAALPTQRTGSGLTPGIGKKTEKRMGEHTHDPREAAAAAALTQQARGPGSRDDIDAFAPGGRANPTPAAQTWGAAAVDAWAAEDTIGARGLADIVRAASEKKTRRRWWQLRR